MPEILDLTGQRIGRLLVIKRMPPIGDKRTKYLCVCDCGNPKIIRHDSLRRKGSNRTQSCGCLQRQRSKENLNPRANWGNIREDLLPTKEPTEIDIAWAAGIYEGEGNAIARRGSSQVSVTQKDPWILPKLRDLFGGSVKPHHSGMFKWICHGELARRFLNAIFKYLSPRRQEQAVKALNGNLTEENKQYFFQTTSG